MKIRENLDHRVFLVPNGNIREACQGTARRLKRRENAFHLALNGVDRHFSHMLHGNAAIQRKGKRTDEQEGIEAELTALENIVYNYARSKSYQISIGKVGDLEVDFILRNPFDNYSYVQVARTIYGDEDESGIDHTQEREYRSLEKIQDNYPKYILSLDFLLQNRSGIIHKDMIYFMSNDMDF